MMRLRPWTKTNYWWGDFYNGKQVAKKYQHTAACAHSLHRAIVVIAKVDSEAFCSGQNAIFSTAARALM
jgi:hypothetical protein